MKNHLAIMITKCGQDGGRRYVASCERLMTKPIGFHWNRAMFSRRVTDGSNEREGFAVT